MKKLFTIFAVASTTLTSTTAQAADGGTFLLYGNTYNLHFSADGVIRRHMNAELTSGNANLTAMPDGTKLTVNWDNGYKTSTFNPSDNWTNTEALSELNSTMGLSLTPDNINSLSFVGAASATTSITFDFSNTSIGPDVGFYIFATSTKGAVSGFDIEGMDVYYTATAADDLGSGFDNKKGGYQSITLFKIHGALGDSRKVTISTRDGNKAMFSMVSYSTVPEPATATLSLLALAGLLHAAAANKLRILNAHF